MVENRVVKVLVLLFGLALALGIGAVVGGGIVYALSRTGSIPGTLVKGQVDPEQGIVLVAVVPDGPAAQAGVVRGDILLQVDDQALENAHDLVRAVEGMEPEQEVTLQVLHGDELRSLTATVGEWDGRPYLGLTPCGAIPEPAPVDIPGPGALIVDVVEDGPADQAGLEPGDMVVAVDGEELNGERDLAQVVADHVPGDEVTLKVAKPGEESREVTVQLGENPEQEGAAYLGVRFTQMPQLRGERFFFGQPGGLPFDGPPFEGAPFDGAPFAWPEGLPEQGIVVLQVTPDSPAAEAGLVRGDVITAIDDQTIDSSAQLVDTFSTHQPGDTVTLTVLRSGEEQASQIEMTLGERPGKEGQPYLGVYVGWLFRGGRSSDQDGASPGFRFRIPGGDLPFNREERLPQFRVPERPFEFQGPLQDVGLRFPKRLRGSA